MLKRGQHVLLVVMSSRNQGGGKLNLSYGEINWRFCMRMNTPVRYMLSSCHFSVPWFVALFGHLNGATRASVFFSRREPSTDVVSFSSCGPILLHYNCRHQTFPEEHEQYNFSSHIYSVAARVIFLESQGSIALADTQ
ncbi:hypothetical protein VFPPC_17213 [Pochonia chlamydosporia 170]|uniref:Uncharacterized protein n=1 Tax=Pochonia chlamydosporia 170 TaxID=1380566 RepID=A0A179EVZ0_METCM|nr:hypothetical protein VFPPC_17213 [Pochonia chlamydosporia 170]OAQ57332.1 hypothetical protein VFPPC_17213 [Pochonia chlamydosporia 170]